MFLCIIFQISHVSAIMYLSFSVWLTSLSMTSKFIHVATNGIISFFFMTNMPLCIYMYVYWRRQWQPMPVFLPGEIHGQRSLVVCRPWGLTELDTTEHLTHTRARTHTHTCVYRYRYRYRYMYIPHLLYTFICRWVLTSFPCLSYCE